MGTEISPEKEVELLLQSIKDTSKYSRSVLTVLLVSSAYILIAALSKQMDNEFALPFIKIKVTPSVFFVVAPLLILSEYIYLHIYIRILQEKLKAYNKRRLVFPHPELRDMLLSSWIPTFAFSSHGTTYIRVAAVVLVWVSGPAVLFTLWLRFVGQEQIISLIPCIATIAAIYASSAKVSQYRAAKIGSLIAGLLLISISLIAVPRIRSSASLEQIWEYCKTVTISIGEKLISIGEKLGWLVSLVFISFVLGGFFTWLFLRLIELIRTRIGLTREGRKHT